MNKVLILAFGLLTFAACKSRQKSDVQSIKFPKFDTEGHRGARGLMPENTIPAMYTAIDLGVSTIEMDAHVTSDGQVVLAHDDYINPLFALAPEGKNIPKSDAKKYILHQMTYDELRRFDVGSKFYDKFPKQRKMAVQIPLLADLIDSVQLYLKKNKKAQVFYNIETKSSPAGDRVLQPEPEVFVEKLMSVINAKKITPWVIIQSFDPRTLLVLHKQYPQVKTSYLTDKGSLEENLQKLGFQPSIYSPGYKMVDAGLVIKCHKAGMKVVPWTVNTREEINNLISLGVDGIISDYPDLFKTLNHIR